MLAAVRTVATMKSADEPAERQQLEAAQPQGEASPGQAHAACSTATIAGRGFRRGGEVAEDDLLERRLPARRRRRHGRG